MDKKTLKRYGLEEEEYFFLKERLGREPSNIELTVAGALWSEHCSYKSSKLYLKRFPTSGKRVIIGPGENAGVIHIHDDYVAVFKMESHNHPSYIEPYQGAATGVGGILRDVFTMGARPSAILDALFFGLDSRTKFLVDGVVRGIGDYGNCVGIPTVGGMTFFDTSYNSNILVNAMCIGIGRKDKIFTGSAKTPGNPVFYVGSTTGADGIHGATMASSSLSKNYEEERPAVQVGDPFMEKLLMEACLEAMERGLIEGIQDMGAAGLTSSAFEMANRGNSGLKLYLDKIPTRQQLTPTEILLSESQERMLIIAKAGKENELIGIFKKWNLNVENIGEVTETPYIELLWHGETIGKINVPIMVRAAPAYEREKRKPDYVDRNLTFNIDTLPQPKNLKETILKLVESPLSSDKRFIYEQYDSTVQTNTLLMPPNDSAVIRIKGTEWGIAITTDVNPRFVFLDPHKGTQLAFLESFRNIISVGAEPIAITDCLNFGNPKNPEVMWQFDRSTMGLAEACLRMDIPVVSGNVSFYNENNGKNIMPTPTIGMIGVIKNPQQCIPSSFQGNNHRIVMLGEIKCGEIGGGLYMNVIHSITKGKPPEPDFETHERLKHFMIEARERELILSSHDVSDGGIALCLAEMCLWSGIGADVHIHYKCRDDFYLFSETSGVIIAETEKLSEVNNLAHAHRIPIAEIGLTGGDCLNINGLSIKIKELKTANESFLKKIFP